MPNPNPKRKRKTPKKAPVNPAKAKEFKKKFKEVFQEQVPLPAKTRSGRVVKRPKYYSPAQTFETEEELDYALSVVQEIKENPDYSHSEDDSAGPEEDEEDIKQEDAKLKEELKPFVPRQIEPPTEDGDYVPTPDEDIDIDEDEDEDEVEVEEDEVLDLTQGPQVDEQEERDASEDEKELIREIGISEQEPGAPLLPRQAGEQPQAQVQPPLPIPQQAQIGEMVGENGNHARTLAPDSVSVAAPLASEHNANNN